MFMPFCNDKQTTVCLLSSKSSWLPRNEEMFLLLGTRHPRVYTSVGPCKPCSLWIFASGLLGWPGRCYAGRWDYVWGSALPG